MSLYSRLCGVGCFWTAVLTLGRLFDDGLSAAPTVKRVSPVGLNPGQTTRLTLTGAGLNEITGLLTTTPSTSALAEGVDNNGNLKDKVTFDCTLPADAAPGLQALRVIGRDGVSGLQLFLVDDLPTVALAADNKTIRAPQPVGLPTAVDGVLGNLERRFFRFEATAGQRVAIEVAARRLGSALDPLIVLHADDGREVASADDIVGLGGDCQLVHHCEATGGYIIELRDIRYRGGDDYPFRLRIGDFPCVQTTYPLAVQRGVATQVEFSGIDGQVTAPLAVTVPTDWPHDWYPAPARLPNGQSSGLITLLVSDRPEFLEQEPNDAAEQANAVTPEMQLNGRLQTPGDVDRFQLQVDKGARYVFTGMTRLEGAPTDLQLRVLGADGKQLALADDDGVNEGRLDHTFAEAGQYVLEVSDLLKRGGPDYAYRVAVEPYRATFELEVQADALNVPAGGTAIIPVQATRRGHNGEIVLSIEGLPEGLAASSATIGTGQTKAFLSLTLPAEGATLDPRAIRVVGAAQVGTETVRVVADSSGLQRGRWNNLAVVPPPARGDVVAALANPETLSLKIEPAEVVFGPHLKTQLTVTVRRGDGLDGDVALTTNPDKDALPKEIALALKPIPKGQESVTLELSGTAKAPLGNYSVVLTGTLKQDKTTVTATTPVINYRSAAPLTLRLEPASGPLKVGGTLVLKARIERNPALAGAIKLTAGELPAGVLLAETTIPAESSEAELTLTASDKAVAGKLTGKLQAVTASNESITAEVPLTSVLVE